MFGVSLVLLLISLGLSLRELIVSIDALMLQISDLDEIETGHSERNQTGG